VARPKTSQQGRMQSGEQLRVLADVATPFFAAELLMNLALTVPHAILTPLLLDKGLSLSQILLVQASFSVAVLLFEFPSGSIADMISRRTLYFISRLVFCIFFLVVIFGHGFPLMLLAWIIYGLATGASALAGSLAVLIILRFIVGLGLGAELPVASTYVAEFAPRSIRGRMVVILEAFWAVGWILAAVIGTFVVASGDNGWRWALALGCIPAIYGLVIRMALPESVRYLESRGKTREAEKVVQEFEDSPRLKWQAKRLPKRTDDVQENTGVRGGKSIWSPSLRSRTRNLWIIWFCINLSYYGAFIWIPSLLHEQGFSLVKSFGFTLIITLAQLPGYAVAAWLIERWGRRAPLATFLAGSAAAAGLYGFSSTEAAIIIAGCLLSFFNLGAWGALYAIGPELYPTALRGTGTGAAAGFGRLASILAPLLVPVVLNLGGQGLLFALFGLSFALAAVAAFQLPEQKGKQLR